MKDKKNSKNKDKILTLDFLDKTPISNLLLMTADELFSVQQKATFEFEKANYRKQWIDGVIELKYKTTINKFYDKAVDYFNSEPVKEMDKYNQETNIQKLEIQEETKNEIEIQEKIKVEEKTEIIEKSEKEINKQIFGFGIILLNTARINDKDARRIIGKWLKNNSRNDVLKFIKEALENKIVDPISWVTKQLEKQREDYKQKQIDKAKEKRREFINEINKQSKPELPDSLYPELTTLMEKITKLNKWKNNGDVIIDDELLNYLNEFETKKLFESTGKNPKDYIKQETVESDNTNDINKNNTNNANTINKQKNKEYNQKNNKENQQYTIQKNNQDTGDNYGK